MQPKTLPALDQCATRMLDDASELEAAFLGRFARSQVRGTVVALHRAGAGARVNGHGGGGGACAVPDVLPPVVQPPAARGQRSPARHC